MIIGIMNEAAAKIQGYFLLAIVSTPLTVRDTSISRFRRGGEGRPGCCLPQPSLGPRTAGIVDLVSWDRYNPRGLPFTWTRSDATPCNSPATSPSVLF